ncbi:MAG: hypothetical protein HW421_3950 [Ignavibacteria bacterium]|nr:hypothetical protein [Ignavibacteria bacterium]
MKNEWQKEMFKNHEYWGRIIAIADDKIIAVADNYNEIEEKALKITQNFSCYAVPKNPHAIRIRTFKVRSIKKHEWEPNYLIKFFLDDGSIKEEKMLIDSGADISVISYDFGRKLGFETTMHDEINTADGFGSQVDFIMKTNDIEIDGIRFKNRFAWLQDPELYDMIIGREIVFDLFDIEFKQADEEIIFRKR